MGVRFRWYHHLAQCYVLCWYDSLPGITCSDQGGFPQWRAREKFPSAPSSRASFPERRGLCEGYSCSHTSATDLLHHGPIGHARTRWSCDHHRLLEIWGQFQYPVFLIRLKDDDLLESPDDSAFLQSLRYSCARVNGVYPPLALAEAYITEEDNAPKVRRLHLIVVDLHRRRRMADRVLRLLGDLQVDRCAEVCLHTLPIPWKQNQEAYQLRYVFGYAMEGSDLPCYILWPERTAEQSFWCIDAWKGDWVRLDTCAYIASLGIEHFFDAFCFNPQRPWGAAAIQALGIPSCRVSKDAYLENMQRNTFSLTPRRIPIERKASSAKREVDQDMVAKEERASECGSDTDSGWSGVSDNSSTHSECTDMEASSIASDQDRFDTAYEALQDLANDLYYIDLTRYSRGSTSEDAAGVLLVDGYEKLQEMVHLPRTWPLARLTIPLEGLSKQIDRLLEGYCFQILATNQYPEAHNGKVLQTATHLTWILAEYLSDTIAWLMRSILSHESKILFDKDTQLLLTPKFWLLPLYRELLNSARRIRPSPASERARGCTGLVKVICKENKEQKGKRKYHAGTPHLNDRGGFPQWFGSCSLMTLHVWFPACWAPMVAERLFPWSPPEWESTYAHEGRPDSGPPHTTPQASSWHQPGQGATSSNEPMGDSDSTEVKYKIQWSLPGATVVPVLNVTSRVFWLELDDKALLDSYGVLQEGILCDVFSQKCSAAWQGARGERLTVSVMLPGRQDADDWLNFMLSQKNLWPTFTTRGTITQALFEKDERLIFKRFAKICLLSKQISMKTSLWDFSSLLEKSKVEMELSNLFRFCRHCSLCVLCQFSCVLTRSLLFWFR